MNNNTVKKFRFIEYDFFFNKILNSGDYITPAMTIDILNNMQTYWHDYTFNFDCDNGSVVIIDNNSEAKVSPRDLEGAAYDFYIRKRIELIKTKLLQTA